MQGTAVSGLLQSSKGRGAGARCWHLLDLLQLGCHSPHQSHGACAQRVWAHPQVSSWQHTIKLGFKSCSNYVLRQLCLHVLKFREDLATLNCTSLKPPTHVVVMLCFCYVAGDRCPVGCWLSCLLVADKVVIAAAAAAGWPASMVCLTFQDKVKDCTAAAHDTTAPQSTSALAAAVCSLFAACISGRAAACKPFQLCTQPASRLYLGGMQQPDI